MQKKLRILMAQTNPTIGALEANRDQIMEIIHNNQENHDLIVFPELALTGYPPEDLLFRKEFQQAIAKHLKLIQEITKDCYVVIGHPSLEQHTLYNSVSILHKRKTVTIYHKQNLPNYEVFDEDRYFTPGKKNPCILEIKNYKVGICICEDVWHPGPVEDLLAHDAAIILSVNASPFDLSKYQKRLNVLQSYAKQGVALVYVNQVGGQDELVFDGQSIAIDAHGNIGARAAAFKEELCTVVLEGQKLSGTIAPLLPEDELIYKALVLGTRDYVNKNKFPGVLLGLSGGIDSA